IDHILVMFSIMKAIGTKVGYSFHRLKKLRLWKSTTLKRQSQYLNITILMIFLMFLELFFKIEEQVS
ncbi:MAG TPA: hypothetical protein VHO90_19760, partial [Bacteroidales bacterium]|nr:hypothetical protein [Bacteroidales bacterium]